MSTHSQAIADHASETYPEFSGKIQDNYIEGYEPMSFAAPHSSLLRTSTWVGMGLIMGILPAIGIITWGLGIYLFPKGTASEAHVDTTIIIGVVLTVIISIAAIVSVKFGRRYYHQYRKETGRVN